MMKGSTSTAIHIFRDRNLKIRSVASDCDGMLITDLSNQLEKLKVRVSFPLSFIYTIKPYNYSYVCAVD